MINKKIAILILVIGCLILSGCEALTLQPEEQKFIGAWENTSTYPITTTTTYTFKSDMTVDMTMITETDQHEIVQGPVTYHWKLVDGLLYTDDPIPGANVWKKCTYRFISPTELQLTMYDFSILYTKVQ